MILEVDYHLIVKEDPALASPTGSDYTTRPVREVGPSGAVIADNGLHATLHAVLGRGGGRGNRRLEVAKKECSPLRSFNLVVDFSQGRAASC